MVHQDCSRVVEKPRAKAEQAKLPHSYAEAQRLATTYIMEVPAYLARSELSYHDLFEFTDQLSSDLKG